MEEELRGLGVVALHARMAAGGPVRLDALDDTEFYGVSLGLPGWVERLAWTTFKKVFRRDPGTGALRGWNVAVEQRGVQGPFVDRRRRGGERVTYGHYAVRSAAAVHMPRDYRFGAVIDYATGGNAPWDPVRFTFDPLVSLAPGGTTCCWATACSGSVRRSPTRRRFSCSAAAVRSATTRCRRGAETPHRAGEPAGPAELGGRRRAV